MPRHGDRFYEEVTEENALAKMLERIEKVHGSKIKRIPRQAQHEGNFYLTVLLENYEMLEVTLSPTDLLFMGKPSINVEIEVY